MSTNLDILRGVFERWNAGDTEPPLEHIHPDCELVTRLSELRGEPYIGHDGVRQWVADIAENFESWRLESDEWQETGDTVLSVGHAYFMPKGGNAEISQSMAWVFDMQDGLLIRWRSFTDLDEARRAALA